MRAVLDTNVIVSAVLSGGSPPDLVLRAWRKEAFQLVTSAPLLRELEIVLRRDHIAGRLGWLPGDRRAFIGSLRGGAIMVIPEKRLEAVLADPSDNRVLEAAVAAQADYVVSGDQHLLTLKTCEGVQIVTPARFVAVLVAGSRG
jgi:putative PIN family toxin of toxin-antitoxin system